MIVLFDSREPQYKQPFGALATGETVSFTLKVQKTVQLTKSPVLRLFLMDQWDAPEDIPLSYSGGERVYSQYTASFSKPKPALYAYRFVIVTSTGSQEINRTPEGYAVAGQGDLWQLTVYDAQMKTPDCLREGVLYQIFPDRFYNSGRSKENVPKDRTLREDWGGMPYWRPNPQGEVTNSDYFGGDLEGIRQKLPYLQMLGVTALYLNPIFEAHSNHRYNTADYKKVDPLLGTEEEFKELCKEAKSMGISILLDGVFSHTGSDSVYFNREGRYPANGAYNSKDSPYYPWYRFYSHPDHYESWWGFPTLPNVEETEPSYLEFICGAHGVLRYWMELGAAGFRLDVADELPDLFLDQLRLAVKETNPGGAIIGEVWEDASNKVSYGIRRRYLLGQQLDSVMNYPFKDALLQYIRYGDGNRFYCSIMTILENYPKPVIPALMNSISTHDTPRAITMLVGEELGQNGREWQEAPHNLAPEQYELGKKLLLLTGIVQFGLPGIPCIYYGDEAGLSGYKDPFCRCCFPWDKRDTQLTNGFRQLGRIRSQFPIFCEAEFIPWIFGDDVCAFLRQKQGCTLLYAVNRSPNFQPLSLPLLKEPETLFISGEYSWGKLAPYSGVVLHWEE